jgi:hypothetical protein
MPEPHPAAEFDQAGRGAGAGGLDPDSEPLGRTPHQHRVTDRLSRGDQQQQPRRRRKRRQPPPEALLDPAQQCRSVGQPEPARQLRGRQAPGELQQCQGVAAGLGDEPVAHPLIQRAGDHRCKERPRIAVGQPRDLQLR